MSLAAAGFQLCDDIYPPPVGAWLWISETALSDDEECWHCVCYRDGADGAAWAYHAVIYATWWIPPVLEDLSYDAAAGPP